VQIGGDIKEFAGVFYDFVREMQYSSAFHSELAPNKCFSTFASLLFCAERVERNQKEEEEVNGSVD
jgi:hypothetical protein